MVGYGGADGGVGVGFGLAVADEDDAVGFGHGRDYTGKMRSILGWGVLAGKGPLPGPPPGVPVEGECAASRTCRTSVGAGFRRYVGWKGIIGHAFY